MHVLSWGPDDLAFEADYNTYARRLFPWPGVPDGTWGGAWCAVRPGETSVPHAHGEREVFFVVEGDGVMSIDGEERPVRFGDTIFITPERRHFIRNAGPDRLLFLSIWWDEGPVADAPS